MNAFEAFVHLNFFEAFVMFVILGIPGFIISRIRNRRRK